MTTIDFTSLEQAIAQLEEGIRGAEKDPKNELLRDGVIQRFEYSLELCLKFIRRVLEVEFGEQVDRYAYRDLIRSAREHHLLSEPERWFTYREARNRTSHTYDQSVAAEVYAAAKPFLADAEELLAAFHTLKK